MRGHLSHHVEHVGDITHGAERQDQAHQQPAERRAGGEQAVSAVQHAAGPAPVLLIQNGEVTLKHITAYDNAAERMVNLVPDMFDKVTGFINRNK